MTIINKLSIHHFRNLDAQYILPCKNINLLIGDNAQGKTNLIEAIYYLGHNRSFKTKTLKEIINFSADKFQLNAEIDTNKIKIEKSINKNIIHINQQKISNTSQLSQLLPIQIISPDRGFIVNGTPKNKRSYLDWGVFHLKPEISKIFKNYHKILKNINTLLANNQIDELEFWFLELAKNAVIININRLNYLQQLKKVLLSKPIKKLDTLINSLDKFNYQFSSGWPKEVDKTNAQSIFKYLIKNKSFLLRAKHLNYGSHKSSIIFSFNHKKECFLSRGEQKTLSIIFWLTQVILLTNLKIKPIVLIDDLSSELDEIKINSILHYLTTLKTQTFITNINHNSSIINQIKPKVFEIKNGEIK